VQSGAVGERGGKLVTRDKVVALLGAFCSTSTAAMMEVAKKHKVPHITGISTAAQLTEQGNPYFFRAVATTPMLGNAFGGVLPAAVKAKRFAFLVLNDDWGRSMAASYRSRSRTPAGRSSPPSSSSRATCSSCRRSRRSRRRIPMRSSSRRTRSRRRRSASRSATSASPCRDRRRLVDERQLPEAGGSRI
jgi:hypothetical protein